MNVVQSVEVKYPFTDPVAAGIEIVLVALLNGDEKVNALSLLLNVVQSVEVKYPLTELVAAGIDNVLLADKSPPPVSGDVVDIILVVSTLVVFK